MPKASVRVATAVKPGARPQRPRAISQIANKIFEQGRPEFVAGVFLDALEPAEPDERLPARLGGRHAAPNVLLGLLIDVEAHLFVESALDRITANNESANDASFRGSSS